MGLDRAHPPDPEAGFGPLDRPGPSGGASHEQGKDTVTTSLKQQGRDVMVLPEGAWDAHKNRQPAPRLLAQRG
jgi:hypothetical protein